MKTRITAYYLLCAGMFLMIATSSFGQLTKVWENHYVSKYDSNLVYVSDGTTYGNELQFDGAGNCYFLSEVIPPSTNNQIRMNHPQMQVIKYNPAGATLWIHKDTGNYYNSCTNCGLYPYPYQMIVHNDGTFFSLASESAEWLGYYLLFLASTKSTGLTTWDTSTLINQYNSYMAEDYKGNLAIVANSNANWNSIALSKVTSTGSTLWTFLYGSPGGYLQSAFPKVTTDKAGNSYVLHGSFGQFPDTADMWISKFDTSGSLLWDKLLDSGISLAQRPPDIIYNATDSCLYATYVISKRSTYGQYSKLVKYKTTGSIQWMKTESLDRINTQLKQDKEGNIYWWTGVQGYGSLPYPFKTDEGNIYKYNTAGTLIGLMHGNSFDIDASGYTYTTNYFFDPKTYNRYDDIRKYSPAGTLLYEFPASLTNDDNYSSQVYLNSSTNLYTLKAYHNFDTVSVTKYSAACSYTSAPAKPKSITGSKIIYCNYSSYVYSCPAVSKAIYYNWIVPTGIIIDSGQGTNKIYVRNNSASETGQISVYAANCYGASPVASLAFTDTLQPPGKITGPTSVCKGQMYVQYSIPAVAGAQYYQWSIPADASYSIGYGGSGQTGTPVVSVNFGNTSSKVSVFAANGCDSSVAKSIQVKVTNCVAGMNVEAESSKSIVYPNPSSGIFTLKFGSMGKKYHQPVTVVVKDVSGKVMEQLSSVTASTVSFGSRLVPGVYFVEVITGNEKQVLKVVKE